MIQQALLQVLSPLFDPWFPGNYLRAEQVLVRGATTRDQVHALDLLNRLVSRKPDYPGVWWLRARVLKDLGRERDAIACEHIARIYAEPEFPEGVRKFPL